MTTIGMHYDVLPGKEQTFVEGFTRVLDALKQTPGHQASHLYQDVHDTGSYLIISEWQSMETFQAFIQSDVFRGVTDWGKQEILRGRPRHRVYAQ